MEKNSLNQRIDSLVWHYRLSQSRFAKKIGVSSVTMSRIIRGGTPSMETVDAITRAFPDVNPTWLLTGEGDMLRTGGEPAEQITAPKQVEVSPNSKLLEELQLMRKEFSRLIAVVESQQELLRKHSGNRARMMHPQLRVA